MNIIFLIGKIITEIKFKFVINSKNNSITEFTIKTQENKTIQIKAYNENADYIYGKIKKYDNVFICGYLTTEGKVVINKIKLI